MDIDPKLNCRVENLSLEKENNYKIKDIKRIISISNRDMLSNLLEKELPMDGSIIDVQKSTFIDFFVLHIIDYLC